MTREDTVGRSSSVLIAVLVGLALPSLLLGGVWPLVGSALGPTSAAAQTGEAQQTGENGMAGIRDVTYSGLAVVRYDGTTTYLLEDEPHRINVSAIPGNDTTHVAVCVETPSADEEICSSRQRVSESPLHTTSMAFDEWPGNQTGETNLTIRLISYAVTAENVIDERNTSVHVLAPDVDHSGNGLTTSEELAQGTNFTRIDTDRDGLSDGAEVNTYGTDPLSRDTAGNGVPDGTEVLLGTNPTNRWTPHSYLFASAVLLGIGFGAVTLRLTSGDERPPDTNVSPSVHNDDTAARGAKSTDSSSIAPGPVRTDEDRVIELLERSDGQVRQKDIVRDTNWSKSKVSRVLSRMEEENDVSRIRIGRENIVRYGDDDIAEEVTGNDEANRR